MDHYIGIDLGTTFSAVAYITPEGKPVAIPNEYNNKVTPSVVYLGPGGPLVGEEAQERLATGDEEAAAYFKRYMGDPNYVLSFQGQTYTPTDLSTLVLAHLKGIAESYLGGTVTHAVVTVPAYFNNLQREATIAAGKKANLEVLSIINEPTAAALAYGLRPATGEQTVLVYDLGGGTFDVSVVQITSEAQRVLGTGGDYQLGGKDWDDRICEYLASEFTNEFEVELDNAEFYTLLAQAEQAKKSLSTRTDVEIRVHAQGCTGNYTLSREKFEELTSDLMMRTQGLTEQVLKDIKVEWSDIDNVLLIGGSTRMPMVKEYAEGMSGKMALTTINPDEAVALGAAIQAAFDVERKYEQLTPLFGLTARKKSIDVMSHSLGMIAVSEDGSRYLNSIILPKNQPIPSTQTRPYQFYGAASKDAKLEVFMTQGETDNPMDCVYLGKYVFSDFPSKIGDPVVLDITYTYNQNGMVDVSGEERASKTGLSLSVEPLPDDVPDRFMLSPEGLTVREHLTVYLTFDLSGSMSGAPLQEAKKAAHAFVSQCDLSSTSVGLISVSDNTKINLKASQDVRKISRGIDNLNIGDTGIGNEGHPFGHIHSLLKGSAGLRYAIVLADGVWSHQDRAIRQAKICHREGIEIVGVGFGGADRAFLRDISSSDEKSIFTDMGSLTKTFSTIAQELTEGRGRSGSNLLSV